MGDWKWYAALGLFIFMMAAIYILLTLHVLHAIPNPRVSAALIVPVAWLPFPNGPQDRAVSLPAAEKAPSERVPGTRPRRLCTAWKLGPQRSSLKLALRHFCAPTASRPSSKYPRPR